MRLPIRSGSSTPLLPLVLGFLSLHAFRVLSRPFAFADVLPAAVVGAVIAVGLLYAGLVLGF